MNNADWEGFGIRLGRAIDRWPGGGQGAFAEALATYASEQGVNIPKSYRTLVNYLNGRTRPSEAWVRAAAEVLRWSPENLLTGQGPERPGQPTDGATIGFSPEAAPRAAALSRLILNNPALMDLPMSARFMLYRFLEDYFGTDLDGWGDAGATPPRGRREQVMELLERYFAPLLSRPTMDTFDVLALTASLVAAAYVRAGDNNGHDHREDS